MSKMLRQMLLLTVVFLAYSTATLHAMTTNLEMNTTVSGQVLDVDGDPLPGVNVVVKGTVVGTPTNANGEFSLTVQINPPITLQFSIVGFQMQELLIEENDVSNIRVVLEEQTIFGMDVVVSASRVEESILKSPVSIEKLDILDIKNTAATSFYDAIRNVNGVDFSTQSITFNSVNARGFGSNGNTRFVQLLDGVDGQAPGLNFPIGNILGASELDVESVELIPGAASALYGPNAMNGILLLNSKSPFDYQGLDIRTKVGTTHQDGIDHEASLYQDTGFRYAQAINNKFAFKVSASWLNAQDFVGVDYRDQSGATVEGIPNNSERMRDLNRVYDGVNTYGDFTIDIGTIADITINSPTSALGLVESLRAIRSLLPNGANGAFTPTGYRESDFVDNTAENIKIGTALHYRLNDKIEAIAQFNAGLGNTVYTANDRFILDDLSIWTGKLELRGSNFSLRAYTTQENSGNSYAANTVASLINQRHYLPVYFGAYVDYLTGGNTTGANPTGITFNATDYNALHNAARAVANAAQPSADSDVFKASMNEFRNKAISEGGAKFLDKSALYHYEGSYNFGESIKFANILVGANFRTFALNSEGTLFALDDNGDEVSFNEYGGYIQLSRDLMESLKIQTSMRYDKNENFEGQISPRASAVWEFANNQNLRASYQKGFRMPTTQDQYIDLDVVTRRLLGRNELIADRYNLDKNTVYTTESVQAAQASGNVSDLVVATDAYKEYKTEKVTTFEVGYKSVLFDGKLFLDLYYYNSTYQDFGAEIDVTQAYSIAGGLTGAGAIPTGYTTSEGVAHSSDLQQVFVTGGGQGIGLQRYGYDTNMDEDVNTYGFGLSADLMLFGNFKVSGNATYNKIEDLDDLTQRTYNVAFNTPEWRYNFSLSNRKLTDKIGFNMTYRWQDAYLWQSSIGSGIIPDFQTLDAQVSYALPALNASVKVGGSNILNERYTTSFANPNVGAIYYIQLNFENLLNR